MKATDRRTQGRQQRLAADAELANITDEHVLSELLNTEEPTAEGKALLQRLRRTLARRKIAKLPQSPATRR
jgi:hypothetical protein